MKIGDEVYVHGYIDEIRKDTIIIRNEGGYFGTDKGEIVSGELRTRQDVVDAFDKALEIVAKRIKWCMQIKNHSLGKFMPDVYALTLVEQEIKALKGGIRDCKTCGHSTGGKRADTEECHDCMWESKYVEADKEGEQE